MDLEGSRPWPVKTAETPRAAVIGIRKRSVEPLSPQSRETVPGSRSPADTVHTPFSSAARTPRARTAPSVARMSSERSRGERMLSPSPGKVRAARAAQRIARWAALFEGGALTREQADAINEAVAAQSAKMAEIKTKLAQQRRGKKSGAAGRKLSAGEKIGLLSSIQQSLGGVGTAVNALAEQYPVLYSSVSMEHFQRSISDVEEHLQAARRLYNANVSLYNQTIASFPWLVVARIHGMEKAEFYEIDDKKREFKVNFD